MPHGRVLEVRRQHAVLPPASLPHRPGLTGRARALRARTGGDPHRARPKKGLPAGQRQPGAAGDRGRRQQAHKAVRSGDEEVPAWRCCRDRARAPPPPPVPRRPPRRRLIVYCFEAAIEHLDKERNPDGKTVGIFDLRGGRPPGSGASMQAHTHSLPCNGACPRRYPAREPGRRGAARRVCGAAGLRGPLPGLIAGCSQPAQPSTPAGAAARAVVCPAAQAKPGLVFRMCR